MAAHMISIARREYTADWSYATAQSGSAQNGRLSSAAGSSSSSSSSEAAQELQAVTLRSGVATMEPNEGVDPVAPAIGYVPKRVEDEKTACRMLIVTQLCFCLFEDANRR